jgi:hypothetical protein
MYQLVASSITYSMVTSPTGEEVSIVPVAGEGSGTSAAGEGSGTSAAGEGSAITTTGVGSDTGVITTSRPPDDGGAAKSSSKTTSTARAGLGRWLQGRLRSSSLCGLLSLLNSGGRDWWRRRAQCLRRGNHSRLLFSPHRQRLGAQGLGTGLGSHHSRAQRQALQGRKAEHSAIDMPSRRQKAASVNKTSQKIYDKKSEVENSHLGAHPGFLRRAARQALLGGFVSSPARGLRIEPANSRDAPLRSTASTTATRSPTCSGADPQPLRWPGLDCGPHRRRGTHERPKLCRLR